MHTLHYGPTKYLSAKCWEQVAITTSLLSRDQFVLLKKLQAVRLRLSDGQTHLFFGPAVLRENDDDTVIESIDFSGHFEYESDLSLSDLWLLVQNEEVRH